MNTLLMPLIAIVSGEGVIQTVLWLVVAGLIFYLLFWLIQYVGLPEPFSKVAKVILAVAAVIILINILLSLIGHPFIHW